MSKRINDAKSKLLGIIISIICFIAGVVLFFVAVVSWFNSWMEGPASIGPFIVFIFSAVFLISSVILYRRYIH